MSERTVRHVGHAQLASRVDETVRLMHGLEGRVLGLDGIDLCDWKEDMRRIASEYWRNRRRLG